ncbi:MAG: hypothetical protein WEB60_02875 [Terrimicrobiaceae bacterium]
MKAILLTFGGLLHVITQDGLCGFFTPDESVPLHITRIFDEHDAPEELYLRHGAKLAH